MLYVPEYVVQATATSTTCHALLGYMDTESSIRSLAAWMRQAKGVVLRDDWLKACVEWIVSEEVGHETAPTIKNYPLFKRVIY